MSYLFKNWKTTVIGVIILALGALASIGIHIPGVNIDLGTAIPIALGMFAAKDANVTGGEVKQ